LFKKNFCPIHSAISDAILEGINRRKDMASSCRKMA
jgi:hypothetical protein